MKNTLLLLLYLTGLHTFANIHVIDFSKITKDKNLLAELNYVTDNLHFYTHWSMEWDHEVSKSSIIEKLEITYNAVLAKGIKGAERDLLLGDLAHFMYNLEAEKYHAIAVGHYNAAQKAAPKDYRGSWFLANHYANSNQPALAVNTFLKAEGMLPAAPSAEFWEEYAYSMTLANMPTHSLYAMSKSYNITGKMGKAERTLGPIVQKNIQLLDSSKNYEATEIWDMAGDETLTFISRPLGLSVAVDSTWQISVQDYENRSAAFVLFPPKIKSKSGREISYSTAIFMRSVNDTDKLEDFVSIFSNGGQKKKISFSTKYDDIVAYEITNPEEYTDMGGGHFYVVGVARNAPEYPGLLLEKPVELPDGNGEVQVYTLGKSQERFGNKIFYVFMLDTCEDIHTGSLAVFKDIFEKQVVLE